MLKNKWTSPKTHYTAKNTQHHMAAKTKQKKIKIKKEPLVYYPLSDTHIWVIKSPPPHLLFYTETLTMRYSLSFVLRFVKQGT